MDRSLIHNRVSAVTRHMHQIPVGAARPTDTNADEADSFSRGISEQDSEYADDAEGHCNISQDAGQEESPLPGAVRQPGSLNSLPQQHEFHEQYGRCADDYRNQHPVRPPPISCDGA